MTAAVINPSAFPVVFPASQGWHKDGRDVTIYAIQLFFGLPPAEPGG
jgi:hypothetical protein